MLRRVLGVAIVGVSSLLVSMVAADEPGTDGAVATPGAPSDAAAPVQTPVQPAVAPVVAVPAATSTGEPIQAVPPPQ